MEMSLELISFAFKHFVKKQSTSMNKKSFTFLMRVLEAPEDNELRSPNTGIKFK